jgi:3-oxoacyl-[acyl-carrier protein] reductase
MKKTALITGASRGIGAACARALAADGNRVAVNFFKSEKQAKALTEELGGVAVRADISARDQVEQMFNIIQPDILVCNAGVSLQKLLTDTEEEEWQTLLDVNLGGVIRCCRAAIPAMVRNHYGRIIIISSVWGTEGAACEAVYAASKAALHGLVKSLCKELGPSGIRVNCVAPGVIDTAMNAHLDDNTKDALKEETPLQTIGSPRDVAEAILYLASEKAGFVTGQVLGVNGGMVI